MSDGLCECGCGERTRLAPRTQRTWGWVKGEPLRFVQWHAWNRGKRRKQYDEAIGPRPLCRCGCGAEVQSLAARWLGGHAGRKSPVDYVERADGCWEWRRKVTRKGYGILEVSRGRAQHAHRWVYEREVGPIPEGMELHHECGDTLCVNPAHLTPIAVAEHRALHA